MINRIKYIAQIRPFYESDLIKVITGIRRCGKSVVLEQIKNELVAQGKRIVYLNFEDRRISATITTDFELVEYVENELSANPNEKLFVFLDEVQMVKNWNIACRSLRLRNPVILMNTGCFCLEISIFLWPKS